MKVSDILTSLFGLGFVCASAWGFADAAKPVDQIACRYEMNVMASDQHKALPGHRTWYFWRQGNNIQTQDENGDFGEIWEKTGMGSIQYKKLYHADKTAVEYMPADMPNNQMNFDWFKLSSMLSREELDGLKVVKKMQVLGRSAELRTGKAAGQDVEVLWLPDQELPARIVRKDKSASIELQLLEIAPLSEARRQPVAPEVIANYRHIDAADFGDMENDPFVKKVTTVDGHPPH